MDNRQVVIHKHFAELAEQYPGLALTEGDYDTWVVRGVLEFSATYEGVSIRDNFHIEITITKDYPDTPPIVKETGGRIPKEFHTSPDGSLCLGAPIEVRMKFAKNQSLLGFVNEQVIPFLYSYCYFEQHGEMPFGELSHGGKGILEYYRQLFNASSDVISTELLKILAENNYKGHHECPCRSGKRIRDCHGGLLRKIYSYQHKDEFLYDYGNCLIHLKQAGQKLPKSLISKKLMNRIKKYGQGLDKNEKRGVNAIRT
ncbi:MAG: hypothetical protein AB1610_02190 [Nitrospirota bacterium]